MRLHPQGVEFQLPGLTKTSSEISSVFFAKFEQDHKLCVLRCLQAYLEKTRIFRPILAPSQPNQLLIRYRGPHAPLKSCTIARWTKSVLGKAGIDTSILKAHSTRSASPSRALSGGVSLEEVLKMADWSGPSRFKGEVRVHDKLGSNERLYNAYLAYTVSCLQIKYNSRNKATNLLKFACSAAAIIYIEAKLRSCSGFTL